MEESLEVRSAKSRIDSHLVHSGSIEAARCFCLEPRPIQCSVDLGHLFGRKQPGGAIAGEPFLVVAEIGASQDGFAQHGAVRFRASTEQ
jgi:hypothetical protein